MNINIAYPLNGSQKKYAYKDEKFWAKLYDLKISEDIQGD